MRPFFGLNFLPAVTSKRGASTTDLPGSIRRRPGSPTHRARKNRGKSRNARDFAQDDNLSEREICQVRGARRGSRTSRSSLMWSIPVASRRRLISEPKVRKMQSRTHSVVRMGVEAPPDFSRNGVSSSALLRTDIMSAEGAGDLSPSLPFFDMRNFCHTRLPPSSRLA